MLRAGRWTVPFLALLLATGSLGADTKRQWENCIDLGQGCDGLEGAQHLQRVLNDIPDDAAKEPTAKGRITRASCRRDCDQFKNDQNVFRACLTGCNGFHR
jgi:hypothetical protein